MDYQNNNPYGQNPNPYGQTQNPYGQNANPYGQNVNPYGQNTNQYVQNNVQYVSSAPVGQLSTSRGLLKVIILSLITFGIYGIIFYSGLSEDVNAIASRYDGRKTMHYCLMCFVVAPLTLGIGLLVWCHNISDRIGNELKRRGIDYSFNAGTFWLWYVLGAIVIVGPFVYLHKMCVAMNKLSENYNMYG